MIEKQEIDAMLRIVIDYSAVLHSSPTPVRSVSRLPFSKKSIETAIQALYWFMHQEFAPGLLREWYDEKTADKLLSSEFRVSLDTAVGELASFVDDEDARLWERFLALAGEGPDAFPGGMTAEEHGRVIKIRRRVLEAERDYVGRLEEYARRSARETTLKDPPSPQDAPLRVATKPSAVDSARVSSASPFPRTSSLQPSAPPPSNKRTHPVRDFFLELFMKWIGSMFILALCWMVVGWFTPLPDLSRNQVYLNGLVGALLWISIHRDYPPD